MILLEVVRVVGVSLGFGGAILTAPGAAARVGHDFATLGRRLWARFRGRKPMEVHSGSATALASAGALTAFGERRLPSILEGETDAQIEQLREYANHLSGRISAVYLEQVQQIGEIRRMLQETKSAHAAYVKEQEAVRQQDDQNTLRVNARGLPLIGTSILLSGLPDRWVGIPWVTLALLTIAALLVFITILRLRQPGLVDN